MIDFIFLLFVLACLPSRLALCLLRTTKNANQPGFSVEPKSTAPLRTTKNAKKEDDPF